MGKLLSISVAAYNAETWIKRCIDSMIIPEIIDKIEIIIVNDGSKDSTTEIAKDYERRYPNSIIAVNKDNGGHGSTINTSKKIASGKYFKVVDSDDWVAHDGFVSLVNHLSYVDDDIIFSPYYVYLLNEDKYLKEDYVNNIELINDKKEAIHENIKPSMHSLTIRTDLIKSMPEIDEHCFYVDVEYVIYSISKGKSLDFLNEPVYVYYIGREGQSVNPYVMFKRRNQHLKVCKSIVQYYSINSERENIFHSIIRQRLVALIMKQYKIIFLNPNYNEGKNEVLQFDSWLKESSLEIYIEIERLNQSFAKCIKIMRRMHYLGYGLVARMFRNRLITSIQNSY